MRSSLLNKTNPRNQSVLSSIYTHPLSIYNSNLHPAYVTHHQNSIESLILSAINDQSYPDLKKKNIYDIVSSYTSKFNIIPPENKYLIAWHGLIMTIILYYLFEIGLLLGYGVAVWDDILRYLIPVNIIFIICLVIDCFLSLFKAFYSKGLLIKNHRLIAKKYISRRLLIDIIAIISVTVPFATNIYALNWIKLLFIPKMITLYQIDKEFIRITELSIKIHTFYLLNRLIMFLILGSHYIGIFFYMIDYYVYVTNYYGPNTPNLCWIYNAQAFSQMILILPWYGQYEYTMYFSIGTMTTIAYGDITPLNPLETIYITLALLLYTVCFAYILSQVLRILMQAQASKFEHTNTLLIITNMMRDKMISEKVQIKVRKFYEKMWKEEVYRNRPIEDELVSRLPQKIKNDLFEELYEDMFIEMGFLDPHSLKNQFIKTDFMIKISNGIKEERLVEGTSLYKQNEQFVFDEPGSHSFYFIKQQAAKIKDDYLEAIEIVINNNSPQNKLTICKLQHGSVGYGEFLTGDKHSHEAIALRSVIAYKLTRRHLLESLSVINAQQKEKLSLMIENIDQKQCYICKERNKHSFKECPYATYQPDKYAILRSQKYEEIHNHPEPCRAMKKFRVLQNLQEMRDKPYKIRNKYQMLVSKPYYSKLVGSPLKKSKSMNQSLKGTKFRISGTEKPKDKEKEPTESMMFNRSQSKQIKEFNLFQGLQIRQIDSESEQQIEMKELQSPRKSIRIDQKESGIYGSNILDQFNTPKQQEEGRLSRFRPQPINVFQGKTPLKSQQAISQNQSYDQESSSSESSSESEKDIEQYMKQTQVFVRHLQQQQNAANLKKSLKAKIETNLNISKSAMLINLNNNNRLKLEESPLANLTPIKEFQGEEDACNSIRESIRRKINQSLVGTYKEVSNGEIRHSLTNKKSDNIESSMIRSKNRDDKGLDLKGIIQEQFANLDVEQKIEDIRQVQEKYLNNQLILENEEAVEIVKQYSIYRPEFNVSVVLYQYNELLGFNKKRREIQNIQELIKKPK